MNVYCVEPDINRFCGFHDDTFEFAEGQFQQLLSGGSLASIWEPGDIDLVPGKKGDFATGPLTVARIAAGERAKDFIDGLIRTSVELIPFKWKKESYWAIFVPRVADCLNLAESEYWTNRPDNDSLKTAVFVREKIPDELLFRLPNAFKYYCTDEFKDAVGGQGLTGLTFRLVWTDEPQPTQTERKPGAQARNDAPRVKKAGRRSKREALLRRLWEEVIDASLNGSQLSEINQSQDASKTAVPSFLVDGDNSVRMALRSGLSDEELARLGRGVAYRAVFETLVALEEEGALSRSFNCLYEDLLMAGENVF